MKVTKTDLPGVLKIEDETFKDNRGHQYEVYNQKRYIDLGITMDWVQDNISFSTKNVLRGLHGDTKTWKLLSCLSGNLFFVVVNYEQDSEYFGKWQSFILDADNTKILVPPNYLNGHLVLSDDAIFHYKLSEYYQGAENQFSVRWNDSRFNIEWPIEKPILSERDSG